MYKIDFNNPVHVHFIGIGGISMSGLAEILIQEGFTISGSDNKNSALTQKLVADGAVVFYGQRAENIMEGIDVVVYTAAIHKDNEELSAAKAQGLPLLTRAQLLGQLMTNYDIPIAVAGTHGKTTTTSMLSHVLLAGDLDPTISVGGILKKIGGNIRVGKSPFFLTEACEYTNSFLSFLPKIGIILNVDEDHLDFFKDINHIIDSFHRFAQLLPADGTLIISDQTTGLETLSTNLKCQVITYGLTPSADYRITDITYDEKGDASFDLKTKDTPARRIQLSVNGEHNVMNAAASIVAGLLAGLSLDTIQKGLLSFEGTGRRFEYKGEKNGFTVIDDYAHHPTEIRATLNAAVHYPHEELWCVFQPHTYTRTKALFNDFVDALSLADHVILADIYAARETDTLGVSSEQIADALRERDIDAYYLNSFDKIKQFALDHCKKSDVLITMGAGDVVNIGDLILKS